MRSPRFFVICGLMAVALTTSASGAEMRGTPTAPPREQVPAGTLSITISGPTDVATWWTCSWEVYVSGGTPPYTYYWGAQGMIETDSYDSYWSGYAAEGGNVALNVSVADAQGRYGWGYLVINSSSNAPFCY
jgi:hypothetical protein